MRVPLSASAPLRMFACAYRSMHVHARMRMHVLHLGAQEYMHAWRNGGMEEWKCTCTSLCAQAYAHARRACNMDSCPVPTDIAARVRKRMCMRGYAYRCAYALALHTLHTLHTLHMSMHARTFIYVPVRPGAHIHTQPYAKAEVRACVYGRQGAQTRR